MFNALLVMKLFCLFFALTLLSFSLHAATPEQLDALLKSNAKVTVIDLRATDEYQHSHITGAINIPHRLVAEKRLPPLGKVVVYCDGLGSTYAAECVAALNAKPGIQAESLVGGYAAWRTFTNVTADERVLSREQPHAITYEQLKATQGHEIVLVDVRSKQIPAGRQRVNLNSFRQRDLPKSGVLNDPEAGLKALKGKRARFNAAPSLFVVVDDDQQTAIKTAERMKNMGYHRVVILAGGEDIIRRQGKTGLSRQGGALPITQEPELAPPAVQPK